ncbi:uncharacterized protein LOC132198833 [Neocloeon triangulifer]|uniref:uncharacterized protein LOC132198833 n=1 Tax=Neocloeon triangulifer TaxID=2078957 RepID=UPI00286F74ED|nr:uncharacterized protein LOC132198833 [Neocloeon triangulifer]
MEEETKSENSLSASDSGSVDLPPNLDETTADEQNSSVANLGNCSRNDVIRSSLAELPQDSPLLPMVALSELDIRRLTTLVSVFKAGSSEIVIDCCTVFKGDFLRNFPAQTFLLEPAIVECLINACELNIALGKNVDIVVSALECLRRLVESLTAQIYKYQDPKYVVISDKVLDVCTSKHSWSLLEFLWAIITVSSTCIRNSEQFSILNEATCLLKSCLALHHEFFPSSCSTEINRLSLLLADALNSKPPAFAYIQVLQMIKSFIEHRSGALNKSHVLAEVIQSSVIHAGIWLFNPKLSQFFIGELENSRHDKAFSELLSCLAEMAQAISSAFKLMSAKGEIISEMHIEQAVLSLDFIPDPKVAAAAVEGIARAKTLNMTNALLSLLAHPVEDIQLATYQKIKKIVEGSIGSDQAINPTIYSAENILFLCDVKVVQEIASFGLEHSNHRINVCSEDIISDLIRCRILVSPSLWSQVASVITFLIPVLVAKADDHRTLQEVILNYFDLSNKNLSTLELLKGNSCLMFSKNESVRTEATDRLLQLLKQDERSYLMWPQTSTIQITNAAMASLCLVQDPIELNYSAPGIYYNEASLRQIVSLLGPGDSEPTIKYSALCQLAAMLQEPSLINPFVQSDGVKTVVKLLEDSLVQSNTDVLSKCCVPIISILLRTFSKNISLVQEFMQDQTFVTNLIRAMFLYSSFDADFKLHHSALLALVICSDFVLKKSFPSGDDCLVLPHAIYSSLCIPFHAQSYNKVSSYTPKNEWLRLKIMAEDFSSSANLSLLLRCHAAIERYGSLSEDFFKEDLQNSLLTKEEFDYLMQFDPKTMIANALESIQSATTHKQVLSALPVIISYVRCVDQDNVKLLAWKKTFSRFIMQPPSTQADSDLLNAIAQILSRQNVVRWISARELCLKLDHRQAWCITTFVPLIQSMLPTMDSNDLVGTMKFLCNSLVYSFSTKGGDGCLRIILTCFRELMFQQNVEISSRLLADLIVPLVDIVHSYNQDFTFVGLHLIELALDCLTAIQINNLENFFHHFYAYSENCDILNIIAHILQSDKNELKATCFALLTGLAKCNGLKKFCLDFTTIFESAINIAQDKQETNLVRCEAIALINCLMNSKNVDTQDDKKFDYFSLLKCDWFGQISWLHKGIYLEAEFHFSNLNLVSSPAPNSPNGLFKQLVTPELLGRHYALLYNLISSPDCDSVLKEIADHEIFRKALGVLSNCIAGETEQFSTEVYLLTNNCAKFVAICLISDEDQKYGFVTAIVDFPYLPAQLIKVLHHSDFELIANSVLWLIIALLQGGHLALFEDAFQRGHFWPALNVGLENPDSVDSAMLVIRALTIEGEVDCSCLDNNLELLEDLCRNLMTHLVQDETHQHAMAALAGLIVSCSAAKYCVFKLGLLESVVTALKHCINGLSGISEKNRLTAVSKAKMHPLILELIDTFELLTSFVLNDTKMKMCVAQTILVDEINILWPICVMNSKLLSAAIKFLIAYTKDCENACSMLLTRKQLLTDTAIKNFPASDTVLHQLISVMSSELKSLKSSDFVQNVLTILCQCSIASDCRSATMKATILSRVFCETNGITQMPNAIQLGILCLLENLSRYPEGQIFVARIPDAVDFLAAHASSKNSSDLACLCTEILRNLCFSNANRVLIINSVVIMGAFLSVLENGDPQRAHQVAVGLWSLAANNHRTKQSLKAAGFPLALCKAKLTCAKHANILATLNSAICTIEG